MRKTQLDRVEELELGADELKLVLGGRPCHDPNMSSKVCEVGGGCWPDTDF